MARPRTVNKHLPKYVTIIHGSYWYRPPNLEPQKLARVGDESAMYTKLGELTREAPTKVGGTIADYLDKYATDILPQHAERTQKDYRRFLKKLRVEFGHMYPDEVKPRDIGRYLDVPKGKIQRVRTVAVLSAVYTKMVGKWYVAERNPCLTVERHKNPPRTRYITDDEYDIVYVMMPATHQIAMELALLTGQRQGDILKLKWDDVLETGVSFRQGKTGQGRHVLMSPRLEAALTRAKKRLPDLPKVYVVRTSKGTRYTSEGFRAVWQRVMRKAVKGWQPRWYDQPFVEPVLKERFTFHDLRAKCVSDESDVDIAQLRAGHTNKTMTLRVYSRKMRDVKALK